MISLPFQDEECLPIDNEFNINNNSSSSIQTLVNSQPLDHTPFIAPFVPCNHQIIKKSFDYAHINVNDVLIDLGCGDGRILIAALEDFDLNKVIGVELDPHLMQWMVKKHSKWIESGQLHLIQQDMFNLDLNQWMDSTVMILYLLPNGLDKLKPRLIPWLQENIKRRIVTITYSIPDWEPVKGNNIHLEGKKMEYWLFYYDVSCIISNKV